MLHVSYAGRNRPFSGIAVRPERWGMVNKYTACALALKVFKPLTVLLVRRYVSTCLHNEDDVPKKSSAIDGAKAELTKSRVQANRVGKRLIGAYIKNEDIETFRAALTARGTNVQEFFTQVVEKEIAAANGPSALERLIDQRIARFHANRQLTPGN